MAKWISALERLPAPGTEVVVWWQPFPGLSQAGVPRFGRVVAGGYWRLRGDGDVLTPPTSVPLWYPLPAPVTQKTPTPQTLPQPARQIQDFSVVQLPDGRVGWYTHRGPGQKPAVMLEGQSVKVTPSTKLVVLQTPALLARAYACALHAAQPVRAD